MPVSHTERQPDDPLADDADSVDAGSEDAPTRVETPKGRRGTAPPDQASTRSESGDSRPEPSQASAVSPLDALRSQEIARTRSFLTVLTAVIAITCGALFALGGDPLAKQLTVAGLVSGAAVSLWFLWLTRDPTQYTVTRVAGLSYFLIVACYPGVYYWGIFSPAPAIIVMGLALFSMAADSRTALITYLSCAVIQLALTVMVLGELMPDPGLITAGSLTLHEAIALQVLLQGLLYGSYAIAKASRKATLDAVYELKRALRTAAQRQALLHEARQDFDRALPVGGPGRYTDQVVGAFRVGDVIGRGAMGEIYEASHTDSKAPVAIKLLHRHVLQKQHHVKRFMREAEASSQLDSEHVVKVIELGHTTGDVPYMAMERLRGHDLAFYLRNRQRLSIERVIELVRQVGLGLAVARDAGIVHRDIKPQNIFRANLRLSPGYGTGASGSRRGIDVYATTSDASADDSQRDADDETIAKPRAQIWKILDFGISKLAGSTGTLTKGRLVGTPGYMAPEQARGQDVDYRCDLFALGVIAYRALTGHPAFSGKDMPSVLHQVVYSMPKRPSLLVPMSEDVDRVLAIAIAKRPEYRFDSGVELADALAAAASEQLGPTLRARGDALITDHPWGTRKQ